MGDTLLSNDDETNYRLFPFSSHSPFFMNSPRIIRDIARSLKIVLFVILENFTPVSLQKKSPPAGRFDAPPKGGLVLS
jgi:hypothetical protein